MYLMSPWSLYPTETHRQSLTSDYYRLTSPVTVSWVWSLCKGREIPVLIYPLMLRSHYPGPAGNKKFMIIEKYRAHTCFFMHWHLLGPEEAVWTRPLGRVFKHLTRDLANVNAMKQTCDRYFCILPDSNLKSHQKRRKNIKIIVFRTLDLFVQNGVRMQNRTSKTSFPLTMLTLTMLTSTKT